MNARKKLSVAVTAALSAAGLSSVASAASVYADNFNRAAVNGGTYTYTTTTTAGADGGSLITGNDILTLTNDSSATANASGITYVTTPTSAYAAPFNQTLSANSGNLLSWTLNMQQPRTNASGLGVGNYGSAYVLGSTTSSFDSSGSGYALIIGNTGTGDSIKLYRFVNGLAAVALTANSTTAAGTPILAASGTLSNDFSSIQVTYNAAGNGGQGTWKLYTRDDGATAFGDPTTLTGANLVGSASDNTYANTPLLYSGAYWAYGATTTNQFARFDNLNLDVSAAPATSPPRNLVWDGNSSTAPNPSDNSGTWDTATTNFWDGSTNTIWNSDSPDNVTFGAGSGAGTTTVTVAGTQSAGKLTFATASPNYTVTGSGIQLSGEAASTTVTGTTLSGHISLQVDNDTTIASPLTINQQSQIWNVNKNLALSGALAGSQNLYKQGTGTLTMSAASPGYSGSMSIYGGTVRIPTAGVTGGITPLGVTSFFVQPTASLYLDATAGAMTVGSGSGQLWMGDNTTLRTTGSVTWSKNYPQIFPGLGSTVDVYWKPDAGSLLNFTSQIHNDRASDTNPSLATIHVSGLGTVQLGSGGNTDPQIYAGSWEVSSGTLISGPLSTTSAAAESLNNLGFKAGDQKQANTVTVDGTGTLVGMNNTPHVSGANPPYYRANLVLSGGSIATGDNGAGTFADQGDGVLGARFGGNLTVSAGTSKVLVYDALNPANAKDVGLVVGAANLYSNGANTTWNGNLEVTSGSGGATGGKFHISRDGGTIAVTTGSTLQIDATAGVVLDASIDPLTDSGDSTKHVNVLNNGTFAVSNVAKSVGNLTGTGSTTLASGSGLTSNQIRQGSLTLNANAMVRRQASPSNVSSFAGTSKITTLTINSGAKLNITNNKLITASAIGTFNGTNYTGVTGLIQSGYNGGGWGGTTGIVTTESNATSNNDFTSIAIGKAADIRGIGTNQTDVWGGQTVTGSDTLVMYTYGGDANLDGVVDILDYGQIDGAINANLTSPGWFNGDFNYDGVVDILDYGVIDGTINTQGTAFATAAAAESLSAVAVPEPTCISLIGLGAMALVGRRRRAK